MTLEQIDAKLKEAETFNTQLAARKQMYADRIKKDFGADSTEDLKAMLVQVEAQLAEKTAEYTAALVEAETLLKQSGFPC